MCQNLRKMDAGHPFVSSSYYSPNTAQFTMRFALVWAIFVIFSVYVKASGDTCGLGCRKDTHTDCTGRCNCCAQIESHNSKHWSVTSIISFFFFTHILTGSASSVECILIYDLTSDTLVLDILSLPSTSIQNDPENKFDFLAVTLPWLCGWLQS